MALRPETEEIAMKKLQIAATAAAVVLTAAGVSVAGATAHAATASSAHVAQATTASSGGGSVQANEQVIEAFIQQVLDDHQSASGFFTPNATWTGGTVGTVSGGANVAALFDGSAAALPNEHVTLEDIFGQGDQIVVQVQITGTQEGALLDIPATGRNLQWQGVDIFSLSHGKIASITDADDWTAILYETGTYTPPWLA
jgi:predicted ester cyclase